jgi:hypothetical protein
LIDLASNVPHLIDVYLVQLTGVNELHRSLVFALCSANQRRDTGNITFDMESDTSATLPTAHDSPESYEYYVPKEIVAQKWCSNRGERVYLIEWEGFGFHE